jgi:hypothetical protein
MKKILLIITISLFGLIALAQTYDTLPAGSKPYGNFYLGPDGNLVFGNVGLKYRVLGTKKRVDSLLALKQDVSAMANYVTKNGTETLTNKTLTAPVINTPDITNGTINSAQIVNGSINNAPIGSSIENTGRFSTLRATVDMILPSATPTNALSAAPVAYVQNAINGLSWKQQVDLATTGNIALSGTQIVDGVSSSTNKRALVKNQTDPVQNGVYITSSGAWTRSTDASTAESLSKLTVLVGGGVSQQYTVWTSSGSVNIVGTDPVIFVQSAGPGSYLAGQNMTLSGNVFGTVNAPVFDTQPVSDNSNKASTTYFVGSKIATGQTIGANTTGNAGSATKWGNALADFDSFGDGPVSYLTGYNNGVTQNAYIKPFQAPAIKTFLNLNDGSNLNNNASSATKWHGLDYDFTSKIPTYFMGSIDGSVWGYSTIESAKSALNLNDGSSLNNVASNSTKWNGQSLGVTSLAPGDFIKYNGTNWYNSKLYQNDFANPTGTLTRLAGFNDSNAAMHYSNTQVKTFLATSLQDVLNVNNTTTSDIASSGRMLATTFGGSGTDGIIVTTNTGANVPITFRTAGTDRMKIDGSGNVGIGVSPTEALDVNGNGKFSGSLLLATNTSPVTPGQSGYSSVAGTYMYSKAGSINDYTLYNNAGNTVIQVPNSTKNTVFSGSVGIQASTPTEALDVDGNIKSSSLAGIGERFVVADANGKLGISSGEFVTTNTIQTITADKTFDNANLNLTGTGGIAVNDGAFNENYTTIAGGGVAVGNSSINVYSTFSRDVIGFFNGTYTQNLKPSSILSANSDIELPNMSGVIALSPTIGVTSPTPSGTGKKGQVIITGGYRYDCIATNTWVRSAIETTW